jgi:hypothetical protein
MTGPRAGLQAGYAPVIEGVQDIPYQLIAQPQLLPDFASLQLLIGAHQDNLAPANREA